MGDRASAHRLGRWLAIVVTIAVALTACGKDGDFTDRGERKGKKAEKEFSLSVTPANDATNVLTSTEIEIVGEGQATDVAVTDPNGQPVAGAFAAGGTNRWIPAQQLGYNTSYNVAVTAKKGSKKRVVKSSFTTMAEPSRIFGADLYVEDGSTVGVGLPVVAEFVENIPEDRRAAVEKRLFVTTNPPTEGSWRWFSDGEIRWRPREYWKPGTQVSVRLGIGGMDLGNGFYGKRDRTANFSIGSSVVSTIDNASKTMTVTQDGQVVRTIPVSMGKAGFPTSSGTHIMIEKRDHMIMDSSSYGLPVDSPEGYRTEVNWAVRYTWRGEFVHSAPWSVGDQGLRNVSHGCVNIAPDHASWFYEMSKRGDVITIAGTEVNVDPGNGWGDWNIPWEEYVKGSALYTGP